MTLESVHCTTPRGTIYTYEWRPQYNIDFILLKLHLHIISFQGFLMDTSVFHIFLKDTKRMYER